MKRELLLLTVLITINTALANPSAYLTEQSINEYYTNSTFKTNFLAGWVDVSVNNPYDSLQYLRINLSGITNTNLLSITTYRPVAASPLITDKTRMYHNTSTSESSLQYLITTNPTYNITLGLDWNNLVGGKDLNSEANEITFNLTLESTQDISTTLAYQTYLDCYGANDCMNITGLSSGTIIDSDLDGYNDELQVNLTLSMGVKQTFLFNATITPDINFYETLLFVDTGPSDSIKTSNNQSSTLSGLSLNDLFSRGPIQEGVDIIIVNSIIQVRCFIKNIAEHLTYTIHSWEIINVTDNSTIAQASPEKNLNSGNTYYTPPQVVSNSNKQYYSCAFDWETNWQSNTTLLTSESRINGPVLYELDVWADKQAVMIFSNNTGRKVRINDTVRHLGHSSLGVNKTEIYSIIPYLSDSSTPTPWTISDAQVYYKNNTGYYDVTSQATITISNAVSSDGLVIAVIDDLESVIGRPLAQNEDIILSFTALASASDSTETFSFTGNTTMWTNSGTPDTEAFQTLAVGISYCPPCPSKPSCPSCPSCPTCQPTVVEENKTKSLVIDNPWIVEAVPPSTSITINLRNVGNTTITGLVLDLTPRFSTQVDYNPGIGDLSPGEERPVTVTLSSLTRVYDFIFINASDGIDYWTSSFVIYIPQLITPPLGPSNCIEFTPKEAIVDDCANLSSLHCNAYDESCGSTIIMVTAKNVCEASLLNVKFEIDELNYTEDLSFLNKEHRLFINVGKDPEPELSIKASYGGGLSSEKINVRVKRPLTTLILLLQNYEFVLTLILLLTLLLLFILSSNYFSERKKLRIALSDERSKRSRIEQALKRIQGIVKDKKKNDEFYKKLIKEIKELEKKS